MRSEQGILISLSLALISLWGCTRVPQVPTPTAATQQQALPEKLIVPTLPATPTPPEPSGADISESYTRRTQFVPLDNPTFISGNKATFLRPYDRVLGIKTGGASRAYPINMMTYHHIANDVVGGKPILITF